MKRQLASQATWGFVSQDGRTVRHLSVRADDQNKERRNALQCYHPARICLLPDPVWSSYKSRVGMAQNLAGTGAELPALMTAGRWKTSTMPARYIERQTADRGAVARYDQSKE